MDEQTMFKALVWIQFIRAFTSFRKPAGIITYGRHLSPKMQGMFCVPPRVAWILMELPALAVPLAVFTRGKHRTEPVPITLLALFALHYFHRSIVYPLRMSNRGTRMPLITMLLAAVFNGLNTYIQSRWISHFGSYKQTWLTSPQFAFGLVMFVTGMLINIWADTVLFSLRKASKEGEYRVPYGGLYTYVSCPNYLGEIIEWFGWALLTCSAAGFGFFLYTVATLAPRATAHHQWYLKRFQDYPKYRRALIPFLY